MDSSSLGISHEIKIKIGKRILSVVKTKRERKITVRVYLDTARKWLSKVEVIERLVVIAIEVYI